MILPLTTARRARLAAGAFLVFLAPIAALPAGIPETTPKEYKPLPGYQVPVQFWTDHSFHPIGYLEGYPVADPEARLARDRRLALANLFRAAAYACRFKYRQGYPLDTSTPVYRLLRRQYPALSQLEGEGGRIIMSDAVTEFLEGPGWLSDSTQK